MKIIKIVSKDDFLHMYYRDVLVIFENLR